jgi:hypothetical protein
MAPVHDLLLMLDYPAYTIAARTTEPGLQAKRKTFVGTS